MENHILSKSTFIRGLQCHKSLYLYKNFIHLRDPLSSEQKSVFNRGTNIGLLAQKLFPGGVDVSALPVNKENNRYASMVNKTKELIDSGAEVIYEAAFQYDQILIIIDILVKQSGKWNAYEVKSSTRITQTYITDASLQYYIISKSGLVLENIFMVIINNKYIRKRELDIHQLFSIKSIKDEVIRNEDMVSENVSLLKKVVLSPQMPEMKIGEQCFFPYNCDFMGTCWKNVQANSIFEMNAVPKSELFKLYNSGYTTIDLIPENNELDKNANIHIRSLKRGEAVINKLGINTFLEKIKYPLAFMDFETFMPAVPLYENTKPYQHIPFQYSIHYQSDENADMQHFYFLAEQGRDPRKDFLINLLNHTRDAKTIMVYDSIMECNILNYLKEEFQEYSDEVNKRLDIVLDLMKPFQERHYYHYKMNNSFSIKNILHALVPELSYKNLAISSGSIAMTAFEGLQKESDMFKILEVRDNLLKYCELDTLAMVKILEVLKDAIKTP